ncbi:hypothetical protein DFQ10_102112 [Winogradskyella eximia]|uniref:Uncharacterized protein n=1 Tax=Winogradskyella eximia TaxID=262006 RepID=A0A3D9H6Y2_9FLAO|nr:hypothetical protein [Winogradskyella eximia]RED45244.1 hypothetical protein DFQ10_102112 [Winogradskyella eximia]
MVVKIDTSLFSDEGLFTKIDRCFFYFYERRYDFYLDDESIIDSEWIKEARLQNGELMMEAFERTVQNSLSFDLTISDNNNVEDDVYTIDEALFILNNPVCIFLENAVNDGNFILGLFNKFKSKGRKCLKFFNEGWILFKNAGGKNDIINQIRNMLTTYEQRDLDNKIYLRAIVIVDSDKKNPTEIIEANNVLVEFCNLNNITLHILEKREMENYMPIEMLNDIEDINSEKVEAIANLNKVQQDYYDLDDGFRGKSRNELDNIFADLTNEQYNTLKNGLSQEIKTKIEVPKLFLSNKITHEDLNNKCSHQLDSNELLNIIDKIDSLL